MLEGYSGTSGIIQGGDIFWKGIDALCRKYGLLLIVDEVLSGFGRTGEWFGIDHYPYIQPDIMAVAKGLTSGYAPLGATIVSRHIAGHFDEHTLWAGLTYSAHALSVAAGIATIEVYQDENLIEKSREMGRLLRKGLVHLSEKHQSVGEVRGVGLHQVIELVKNRKTRQPLSGFNRPLSEPMQRVAAKLRQGGMSTFVKWDWIFCCPPLIITADQIEEGLSILDKALEEADRSCEA